MPESTIADFPGRFNLAEESAAELLTARVMMSRERVVVASDDQLLTTPLSAITDIAVGNVPPDLDVGSDRAVSIGYDRHGSTRVVTIAAKPDHLDRFLELLFRLILTGTSALVTIPEEDLDERSATLEVEDATVTFDIGGDSSVSVRCPDIQATTLTNQYAGSADPHTRLEVASGPGPPEITVRMPSARKMNLFGRYLAYSADVTPDEDAAHRVLVVDDNPRMLELLEAFIRRERDDIDITGATSATEGLRMLTNGAKFDAIVSDYQMPRTDGIAFLKAVRENHPDLPFILFTGKGNEQVIKEAIKAGVTDYVEKRLGGGKHLELVEHLDAALESTEAAANA